ncbi:MAG: hypothetical protein HQK77_00820 [Desulfobacterales bacterium]|nr:hypothetical protein [Desulfobacterales bacterium]
MPLTIDSFKQVAQTGGQLRLDAGNQEHLTVYGNKPFFGAMKVGWMKTFSGAKLAEDNRAVMQSFIRTMREEYGEQVGNMAGQLLNKKLQDGSALTGRVISEVMTKTSADQMRPKSEILASNRMLSHSVDFEGLLDGAKTECSVRHDVDLSDINAKDLGAFKDKLFEKLGYGGGNSSDVNAFSSPTEAKAFAQQMISDFVTDIAEVRSGKVPNRPETISNSGDALNSMVADLSRKVVDKSSVVMDAISLNLSIKTEKGKPEALSTEAMAVPLKDLNNEQLLRLHENLGSHEMQNLIAGISVSNQHDPGVCAFRKLAQTDLAYAGAHIMELKQAVSREMQSRAMDIPVEKPIRFDSPDSILPENRETISKAMQSRTDAIMQSAINIVSSKVLDAINKPNDPESMKALKSSLEELRNHSGYSYKAEDQGRFDNLLQGALAHSLGEMKNSDLLSLYRGTLSHQMLDLRLQLAGENSFLSDNLLGDLNTIEGMINMEVAQRAVIPDSETKPAKPDDLKTAHLHVLADIEKTASKQELSFQSDEYLKGADTSVRFDPRAETKVSKQGVTAQQFLKVLQDADFTLNLGTQTLCGKDSPFFDKHGNLIPENLKLKNTFELAQLTAQTESKKTYNDHRQFVEETRYPTLKEVDGRPDSPSFFPLSGALNVGRMKEGSAPSYGRSYVALKDNVKQERVAYLPQASFSSFRHMISDKTLENFSTKLDTFLQSAGPEMKQMLNEENKARLLHHFSGMKGQEFTIGRPPDSEYVMLLPELLPNSGLKSLPTSPQYQVDNERLMNVIWESFVLESTGPQYATSFNRLGNVIGDMQRGMIDDISEQAKKDQTLSTNISEYVEGQVFGGIDLTKDIKALHICEDELQPGDLERAQKLATALNAPLELYSTKTEFIQAPFPDPGKPVDKSFEGFRRELPNILDVYQTQRTLHTELDGTHGRRHICRALIYTNALVNMLQEKGIQVDTYALYRAVAFHDSGREKEGEDVFESQSGNKLQEYLASQGIDSQPYLDSARGCVVHREDGRVDNVEAGILQSVDSLDIIRVYGKDGYKTDKLWMMQKIVTSGDNSFTPDNDIFFKLIDEVSKFIDSTEWCPEMVDFKNGNTSSAQEAMQAQLEFDHEQDKIPSTEFFDRMEQVLLQHKDDFPLLTQYYLK